MKEVKINPNLSPMGRKLLQDINGTRLKNPQYHEGLLEFDTEKGTWWRGGKRVRTETAEEVERLCAIKTVPNVPYPFKRFTVSDEGNKLLTIPDYVPVMLRQKQNSRHREEKKEHAWSL